MRRITIDIQGGDSAHRARLSQYSTRAVRFPDGATRLIRSRNVLWEALAQIQSDLAFTEEEFAERVYAHAKEDAERYGTSLEEEIQWCWSRKAQDFWAFHLADRRLNFANV